MQDELLSLWTEVHCTIVFVTHSIEEAILLGNRILVLVAPSRPGPGFAGNQPGADGTVLPEDFRALRDRIQDMLFGENIMREGAGI